MPYRLAILCSCLFICGSFAFSQENPNTEISNHPYAAIDVGSIGTIGLQNGSLTVRIPILDFPQRGKLAYALRFFYDGKTWKTFEVCSGTETKEDADCVTHWTVNQSGSQLIAQETSGMTSSPSFSNGIFYLQFIDADGGSHDSVRLGSSPQPNWISADGTAANGSFPFDGTHSGQGYAGCPTYTINSSGSLLTGTCYPEPYTIEDANGNVVSTNVASGSAVDTDTLNRVFTHQESANGLPDPSCGPGLANTTTYPGPNGQLSQVKTCTNGINASTDFNDVDENGNPIKEAGVFPASRITSISVFDGNSWTTSPTWRFEYNTQYADLTKITLPGGGSVSYTWTNIVLPSLCNTDNVGQPHVSRYVTSRTEDSGDGSGPQTTTYSYSQVPAGQVGGGTYYLGTETDVADSLGNVTQHFFNPVRNACPLVETEVKVIDRALGLLYTTDTDYMSAISSDASAAAVAVNVFPVRVTTTLPNGLVSKVETDYDSNLANSGSPDPVTSYGKVIQKREYAFGAGAPGSLVRCTATDYLAFDNPAYLAANLMDLVSSTTVYNGACIPANQVAQTVYGYDGSAVQSSGVTTQLDQTKSSTAGTLRGNLTSTSRWMGNGAPQITATATYFDTGMPYQSTDPGRHTTTYGYSSQYFGAYRTSTAMPDTSSPNLAHHAVSGSYDLYTGQLTSYTDENNNTTTLKLDGLGRVYNVAYPAGGGATQITFDDDYLTVHQKRQMSASTWSETDTRYDGLGRLSRTAVLNGSSGNAYNQSDVCYDRAGRRSFQSNAYQGAGLAGAKVCSGNGDTFSYDALNRPLGVTHSDGTNASTTYSGAAVDTVDEGSYTERVSQSDALGRLVSVCEVTSQSQATVSPAPCGQDVAKTGFLTTYDYDVLNNLQHVNQGSLAQRVFSYDPASRLKSSFNPESGSTSYIYNPDGTLKTRTRPAPNQQNTATLLDTNYTYDELQRLRGISYTLEGSNSADPFTPNVTMQYDESSVLGTAVSNSSGKLTSEYVSLPGQTGVNAGRYMTGYDAMGRLTNELQCPPRLCSPSNGFDLQFGYDYAGNLISVQNSQFGTQTNSYNAASQLTQITHTLNGNTPVAANLTYNAFGLTKAKLGNGLEEANIYDERGRIISRQLGQGQLTPSLPEAAAIGMVLVNGSDQMLESEQYPMGSVTIGGKEQKMNPGDCPSNNSNCYEYDSGGVSVTVFGTTETYAYGKSDTTSTIAAGLAALFNANFGYNISSSGPTLNIVGSLGQIGAQYSLSASVGYDTDFSTASFTATLSGSTLSGGGSFQYQDYGTVSVSVNGHQDSVPFASCDTAATITYALINAINADSASPVTATAYNSAILLTDKQTGAVGNGYSILASETSQAPGFSNYSFVLNTSGPTLEGGVDPGPATQLTGPVYSFNLAYLPNGNVQRTKDSVGGNWTYTYDDMNRLSTAAGPASYQYVYDRFGNRLQHLLTAGSGLSSQYFTNQGNTNQLDGQCYDAAGNVLGQGNCSTFAYDAENRLVGTNGGPVYVYDASGQRVAKQSGSPGSATNVDSTEFLLDSSGGQTAEFDGSGALLHTNLYAGGQLWATYAGTAMHYQTTDWLGTRRVQTETSGSLSLSCSNLPFGDGQNCTGTDTTEQHFTGKERDAESGLDYFGARYYGSSMGRFMSPDPSGLYFANPANPQSLNLYSYAQNNPLKNVDPTGLDCVYLNDAGSGVESVDRNSSGSECGANGGDYVNGRLSGSTYFANSDTFAFQSYDSSNRYLTYASAPGSQTDGTTCSGDCDRAGGYMQTSLTGISEEPLNAYAQGVFQGVAQFTGSIPNVCGVGITARVGVPGSRLSAGVDVSSKYGTRSAFGGKVAELGGVQGNISVKGGSVGVSFSAPIPDTPFTAGVSTNGSQVGNVNVGMKAGKFMSFQDYANIGTMSSCVHEQ